MHPKKLEFRMPNRISPEREARREKMRALMLNSDVVRLSLNIPTHIHMKFKRQCVSTRQQMKCVILDMMLKFIESQGESL